MFRRLAYFSFFFLFFFFFFVVVVVGGYRTKFCRFRSNQAFLRRGSLFIYVMLAAFVEVFEGFFPFSKFA